jgi:hypothetical protein
LRQVNNKSCVLNPWQLYIDMLVGWVSSEQQAERPTHNLKRDLDTASVIKFVRVARLLLARTNRFAQPSASRTKLFQQAEFMFSQFNNRGRTPNCSGADTSVIPPTPKLAAVLFTSRSKRSFPSSLKPA